MEREVVNAACPCCNAPLRYDGGEGKLACDSCGNRFEVDAMRQVDQAIGRASRASEMTWKRNPAEGWSQRERETLRAYGCPSCGAEIVADDTTAATECVYCGNPSILPGQLAGEFRPDAVLPFVKTREDAQQAYRNLVKGKPLLPRPFVDEGRVGKIAGVYVPFWLFECDADADITFRAERTAVHRRGDYIVTDTDHFLVLRGGSLGFSGVPVDGSSKFDDNLMEAVEPFDYDRAAEFSAGYLPGFQAERYDVDAQAAQPRADERVRQSVVDAFASTVVGYSGVRMQSASIRLDHGIVRNVLIPVWMLNTRWRGKTYTFAMNGQTGKLVGKLPIDGRKAAQWGLGLFAGSLAVLLTAGWALLTMGVF
ncbi:MAG: hypothetical protein GX558_01450 [Clostridiales bacterium]|nr:hypothetical protein [Clostridiales bacterium]